MPEAPHDLVRENAHVMRLHKIVKNNPGDPAAKAALAEARADYAAKKIENYVQEVVDRIPPLTPQQQEEFAAMFRNHLKPTRPVPAAEIEAA